MWDSVNDADQQRLRLQWTMEVGDALFFKRWDHLWILIDKASSLQIKDVESLR